MGVSGVFRNPWLFAAAAVVFAIGVFLFKFRAREMHILWSRLSLKIPLIKDFVMKVEIARFARTFELLMKSGISVLRAIEVTAPVLSNDVLRGEIAKKYEEIAGGGSLGQGLKQAKIFPLFMTNLVSVGEETGKLDEAMNEVANYYEQQTEEAIKIMTSLLEPLMILVMGLVVGFIVIAMLLPMFELNMIVK
jgi:type IV pilus assembly protein PilC